jgi:hypothetical protein
MAARDVADGERHGQNRQPERKRYSQQADADLRKGRRQYRTAAAAQDQPERTQELRNQRFDFQDGFSIFRFTRQKSATSVSALYSTPW